MSLLEEIQEAAIDEKSDLGTLLRKCKMFASRLGSQPLENWLLWESNGYPQDIQVPAYRLFPIVVKAHFTGYGGSSINAVTVPTMCLPNDVRKYYQSYSCRDSIATIQRLTAHKATGKGILHISTGDLKVSLSDTVYDGYSCLEAWGEVAETALIEILNSVRNRILDFALAIEKQEAKIDTSIPNSEKQIEPEKVTQIFNTTIYNGSANIVGNASNSTINFTIQPQDFSTLKKALSENGIEEIDITELQQALEGDEKPLEKEKFGPRVSAWLGKMIKKAAEGTWKVGVSTAGNLLTTALTKYYGLS